MFTVEVAKMLGVKIIIVFIKTINLGMIFNISITVKTVNFLQSCIQQDWCNIFSSSIFIYSQLYTYHIICHSAYLI